MRVLLALVMCIATVEASAASTRDLSRAHQQVPGGHVVGQGHVDMTKKLNAALRRMKGAMVKECDAFKVEELVAVQRKVHQARDPALEAIYQKTGDKGRSMGAFGIYTDDIKELEKLWETEFQMLGQHPQLINATRDTKCHEVVMWFVHHVPQLEQAELLRTMTLPLLPERERHMPRNVSSDVAVKVDPPSSQGCDNVHMKQPDPKGHHYVEWPEELTYTATAHGAFPFWDNAPIGCEHCDEDFSGQLQKVMYSDKLRSEIIMHESCGDMSWTGGSGAPKKSPCNHIFTPDEGAFIYTPKAALEAEADGKFCCQSVEKGSESIRGAVPRDFMKMYDEPPKTYDGFKGDHYSGTIKMFHFSSAHPFWYYTKPDGTPVQQGESCDEPKGKRPIKCGHDQPPTSWHDFMPDTFKKATFSSSDFALPDVCKSTSVKCLVPIMPGSRSSVIV